MINEPQEPKHNFHLVRISVHEILCSICWDDLLAKNSRKRKIEWVGMEIEVVGGDKHVLLFRLDSNNFPFRRPNMCSVGRKGVG